MQINTRRKLLADQLQAQTPRSGELYRRAENIFAGGAVGGGLHQNPWPVYISKGDGAYIWDIDGNRYIDCCLGMGAILFGHNHPKIHQAINHQNNNMIMHTSASALQVDAAEKLARIFPCSEKLFFCNSGTEAVHKSILLARAFTKKTMIAKFQGCYHGTYDQACVSVLLPGEPLSHPPSIPMIAGIPPRALDDTLVLPFNNRAAFDLIYQHRDSLAAVVVEPVATIGLYEMDREFVAELRDITQKNRIPLIFDEVLTGFRVGYGGCQAYFGITPDIATYGKALGGGTAVAAIGCKASLLKNLLNTSPPLRLGGTFSGNPLAMAATGATLEMILDDPSTVFGGLNKKCLYFAEMLNKKCQQAQLPVKVSAIGSMYFIHIKKVGAETSNNLLDEDGKKHDELCLRLKLAGVYTENLHTGFFSTAHTDELISELIEVFFQCISECFASGF